MILKNNSYHDPMGLYEVESPTMTVELSRMEMVDSVVVVVVVIVVNCHNNMEMT